MKSDCAINQCCQSCIYLLLPGTRGHCCESEVKIKHCILFCLLEVCYLLTTARADQELFQHSETLKRSSFPDGFIFGAGSSAYQVEGAPFIDGRRPSIWDTFTQQSPVKILDHSNGSVADDFYHLFKEDIALMKEIGLDSFRFSISWPRVLPQGKISRGVNWPAVNFYNQLINELLLNGIEPFVTLFHWDLPQVLEDEYNGFLSPEIVDDFTDYVDFCFEEFGDRVRNWVTINEPNFYSIYAYSNGEYAPGRCSDYVGNCSAGNSATEPYLVVHHMILCHAIAVKLYRQKYQASQKGDIGISVNAYWTVPKYQTPASREAASRALDFWFGWIIHPLVFGSYPEIMRYLVGDRLPGFTEEQAKIVQGSFNFIGVNYYTANYADNVTSYNNVNLSYTTDIRVNMTFEKNGIPICEPTDAAWLYICPEGLRELMVYLKRKYNNPTIYITENGMADSASLPRKEALEDSLRIKYQYLHLKYLLNAIKEGVDIRGYYIWSFLDDFEWNLGYTLRFGLTYVDYENNLKRFLKGSALWFKNFLQTKKDITIESSMLYSE